MGAAVAPCSLRRRAVPLQLMAFIVRTSASAPACPPRRRPLQRISHHFTFVGIQAERVAAPPSERFSNGNTCRSVYLTAQDRLVGKSVLPLHFRITEPLFTDLFRIGTGAC